MNNLELIKAKEIKPAELFAGDESVDAILNQITLKARDVVALPSTASGRKTIASVAHRVARSKTVLDDMGKSLVKGIKAEVAEIDARRRTIRETLDALKAEVRLPLTEWEDREKARVAAIEEKIAAMRALFYRPGADEGATADELADRWRALQGFYVDGSFEEFEKQAAVAKDEQLAILAQVEANVRKAEAEAIRLRDAQIELAKAGAVAKEKQAAAAAETEKRVGVEGSGTVVRGSKVGGVSGGNKKASGTDIFKEDIGREQGAQDERVEQAQEDTASQQAKKETEVEERDRSFVPSFAPSVDTTTPAHPATQTDMAIQDMIKFGATPVIANMLVVAIQLGQVRCVRFVGEF